jgi:hypothetical protein
MKVGDLVICNCEADTPWKGKVGLLVGFWLNGIWNVDGRGSAVVRYSFGHECLSMAGLEVISESR